MSPSFALKVGSWVDVVFVGTGIYQIRWKNKIKLCGQIWKSKQVKDRITGRKRTGGVSSSHFGPVDVVFFGMIKYKKQQMK